MKQILALIIATTCWGVWGFSSKMASERSPALAVLMAFSVPWALAFPFLLYLAKTGEGFGANSGIFWGIASGLSSLSGMITFILALQWGASSFGIMMVSVYPIITLILLAIFGLETLTIYHGIGATLIIGGLFVLQLGQK